MTLQAKNQTCAVAFVTMAFLLGALAAIGWDTGNDTMYGYTMSMTSGTGGSDGDDTIYGNAGADLVRGNGGNNILFGGDGADIIFGDFDYYNQPNQSPPVPNYIGWQGAPGPDDIYAGDGDDVVYGDSQFTGSGDDLIRGEDGEDTLYGGDGNDAIDGGADADDMYGEDGNDFLHDDDGTNGDLLNGGDGDDELYSQDDGADTFVGGAGTDYTMINTSSDEGDNSGIEEWDYSDVPLDGATPPAPTSDYTGGDPFDNYVLGGTDFWGATSFSGGVRA